MDHYIIKEKLLSYLDTEIPEQEYMEIMFHAEHCSDCSNTLALWDSARKMLSYLPDAEPPKSLVDNVMKSIKPAEKSKSSVFVQWLKPTLAFGTACLLLISFINKKENTVTTENLLLSDISDETISWAFSPSDPDINLLLNTTEEEL